MNRKVKNGLIIFGVLCLIFGIILLIIHFTKKCQKGEYKTVLGCSTCKEGNYCLDNKSNKCPAGKSSKAGSSSVTECENCQKGTFSKAGSKCTKCSVGTYTNSEGASECTKCPTGSTTNSTGSTEASECVCDPGYYGTGGSCEKCEIGYYCTGGSNNTQCPTGSTTKSTGSTEETDCKCNPGYYDSNGSCKICPLGTYNSVEGASKCTQCPQNTTTSGTGSTKETDCAHICNPGTYKSGDSCEICEIGYYCTGGSKTQCSVGYTTKTTGSKKQMDCITCPAGYELGSEICNACKPGYYKSKLGFEKCTLIPDGYLGSRVENGFDGISKWPHHAATGIVGGLCKDSQGKFSGEKCGGDKIMLYDGSIVDVSAYPQWMSNRNILCRDPFKHVVWDQQGSKGCKQGDKYVKCEDEQDQKNNYGPYRGQYYCDNASFNGSRIYKLKTEGEDCDGSDFDYQCLNNDKGCTYGFLTGYSCNGGTSTPTTSGTTYDTTNAPWSMQPVPL
jgi:hypothetical protein